MSTPSNFITRLKRFARIRSWAGVIRKLGALWGVLAAGAGIIIPTFAQSNSNSTVFRTTFELVAPQVWGIVFIVIGAWTLVSVYSKPAAAPYPLFFLGVTVAAMASTTSGAFLPGSSGDRFGAGGSPLVTWLLIILVVAIFIVGSAFDIPEQREHHDRSHPTD